MKSIDMHCDTLGQGFRAIYGGGTADLYEMKGSVDLKRLSEAGAMAQFFAMFMMPPGSEKFMKLEKPVDDEEYIDICRKFLADSLAAHSDIAAPAHNADEIRANYKAGKVSAVLTIEDGRPVQGKLENIRRYYDYGVRAIALTWNFANCFGSPNSKDPAVMSQGLTDFGKEAVAYMQELGMLVDVSHLSDGGFYDVADICKKPFVATHSNCRALSPHQRNLTDDMLKVLGDHGGATGINFGPEFLNADITVKDSRASLMAKHARHIADKAGMEAVALGSDFDGIGGNLEINSCDKMYLLEDALKAEGFSDDQIEMIFCGNLLRVFDASMK